MARFRRRHSKLMRILLSSEHRYPAFGGAGSGLHPRMYPSGSGFWIHDLLMKGLTELGHEVFYFLPKGAATPLPPGATLVSKPVWDADILHTISDRDAGLIREWEARGSNRPTDARAEAETQIFLRDTEPSGRTGSQECAPGLSPPLLPDQALRARRSGPSLSPARQTKRALTQSCSRHPLGASCRWRRPW